MTVDEPIVEESSVSGRDLGIAELLHWNSLLVTGGLFITLLALITFTSQAGITGVGVSLILLILAIALLITSAEFFIEGAKGLARRAGIAEVIIGLTIVSIGTSLPEILVSSTAAFDSRQNPELADLAIGNIFGSVLVQITLILGIVVMVRPLEVRPDWITRDGLLMVGAVLLLSFFLWTGSSLNRIEGLILVSIYIGYISWLLRNRDQIRADELEVAEEVRPKERGWNGTAYFLMVVVGLTLAIFASVQLVKVASMVAISMNVPHAIVGTTMSGLGTSLPELTVALLASKRSQGVAIGTLIGSNITDPLLSVGIAAMINPLTMTPEGNTLIMHLIVPATIIGVVACLIFMRSGFKFNRGEGIILAGIYLLFLMLLELNRQGYISL